MSLEWKCILCQAGKGEPCRNTITPDAPLPGRAEHLARALPPNPKEGGK